MGEGKRGMSPHDRMVHIVAALKHSTLARSLTWPVMSVQFARRDRAFLQSEDSKRLRSLQGTRAGERCFIIGNGPSLQIADLERLQGEVTFGSNRIYNVFDKTDWRPTYYLAVDREFIAQEAKRIPHIATEQAFVNLTPSSKVLEGTKGVTIINKRPKYYSIHKYTTNNVFFSREPWRCVSEGYTVTYTALQLAMFMGFAEIYLLGMDHQYSHYVTSDGLIHVRGDINDHCYVDPTGAVVNPFYVEGVEFSYRVARFEAEDRGVVVRNATRGGNLEVFERINLDDILM